MDINKLLEDVKAGNLSVSDAAVQLTPLVKYTEMRPGSFVCKDCGDLVNDEDSNSRVLGLCCFCVEDYC